jgi:hypothetical protein
MNTDRLIESLARDLRPVVALRAPSTRAAWWLLGALAYLGILTLVMTSREDIAANGISWSFMFPQVAAMLTGTAAAIAAFASTVPGFSRRVLLLPAVGAIVWLGSVVGGAVLEWRQVGGASVVTSREWLCVAMIVFGGAVPGGSLGLMLRKGAPLTPRVTAALGVLAVTALANVSACVSHPHPSHAVTLVWHGSTILALLALAMCGGHLWLTWEQHQRLNTRTSSPTRSSS